MFYMRKNGLLDFGWVVFFRGLVIKLDLFD